MLSIGQLIKIGRNNKKLSQDYVASKLKVTKNYISLVENDRKDPSMNFLKGVAKLLDIPTILLIWKKINLPKGKTDSEKQIIIQLEKMLENAHQLFAQRVLDLNNEKEAIS